MPPKSGLPRQFEVLFLGLVIVILAGCSGALREAAPTQVLEPSTATPQPVLPTDTPVADVPPAPADLGGSNGYSGAIPAAAQPLVRLTIGDLAAELQVRGDEIVLSELEEVIWPDSDLGCLLNSSDDGEAEPVEGYRITLMHEGESYVYNTDRAQRYAVCREVASEVHGEQIMLDPVVSSLVELASARLARQLDLPQRRVFLEDVQAYEWPDSSLGCLSAEQEYSDTPALGYRIVLRVGRQEYYYHTDFLQVFSCPAQDERLPGMTPTPDIGTATPVR